MAVKIIWTKRAKKSYVRTADFILQKWTTKEVMKFAKRIFSIIEKIVQHPEIFDASGNRKDIRKSIILK